MDPALIEGLSTLPYGSQESRRYIREIVCGTSNGVLHAIISFGLITLATLAIALCIPSYHYSFIYLFPIFFLVCNGFEYAFHRFPMHNKIKGLELVYEHVTVHHNFYTNELYFYEEPRDYFAVILPLPIFFMISISIALLSLGLYAFTDASTALFFALVCFAYYLTYEVMHFCYHANEGTFIKRIPLVRTLSHLHLIHHKRENMAHTNFNITFPVFDWICGTLRKQ